MTLKKQDVIQKSVSRGLDSSIFLHLSTHSTHVRKIIYQILHKITKFGLELLSLFSLIYNGIMFGNKSIGEVKLQTKFGPT